MCLAAACFALVVSPVAAGKKNRKAKASKKKTAKKDAEKKPDVVTVPVQPPGPSIATAKPPVVDLWDDKDIEGKGRIVGRVKNCPGCTIELRDEKQKPLKIIKVVRNDPDYTIEWVPAGVYFLHVSGGDYLVTVPNVTVEAKGDTHVDLAFPAATAPKGSKAQATTMKIERWPTWRPTPEPKIPVQNFKPIAPHMKTLKDTGGKKGKKR